MDRVVERQMPINPLSQTLQEHAAEPKKKANPHSSHGIGIACKKEAAAHLKPTQPDESEQHQPRNSQLPEGERAQVMGRGGLRFIHVAVGGNLSARLAVSALI